MFNVHQLLIDPFLDALAESYERAYGMAEPHYSSIIRWSGQFALENIANCDALYHDVEHTIMVTLAGQEILRGKHLVQGGIRPVDWLHFILALLCHDIGYVRGILSLDENGRYATGIGEEVAEIGDRGSSASLAPYHVDRSKRFVRERFGGNTMVDVDAEVVVSYIERSRFPVPEDAGYQTTDDFPGLLRAADFIGQLGDPNYLRKIPALFYEFEETGANKPIGYENPGDMRNNYARFYWNVVRPYIGNALKYLAVTQEGKQWISNLHSHVFSVEHAQNF